MRYIGSKTKLINEISIFIHDNVKDKSDIFCDLFSGTGSVAKYFKKEYEIISNDNLYFSYVLQFVAVQLNESPTFNGLRSIGIEDPFYYLNNKEAHTDFRNSFVYLNYSPAGPDKRMYFSEKNALRIDFIRQQLDSWLLKRVITKNEFFYLLSALIEAVPFISNTTGTYGAFLKSWDKRAFKNLTIEPPVIVNNHRENLTYNCDANELIKIIEGDILYIDPPYNTRQYISNYHVLETIALYDNPVLKGITGTRDQTKSNSKFSSKKLVIQAFENLISAAKFKNIIVSYSSQGIMSKETITNILLKYGDSSSFKFKSIPYRKYKSKIITDSNVQEYLFYIRKNTND